MYKLIAVFLFALAVSMVEGQNVISYFNSSNLHTDTYINLNRQQNERHFQDYNNQIDVFKQSFASNLKAIETQGDMLIDSLNKMNERLNPLEALSKLSQRCVKKYRPGLPTAAAITSSINKCINTANNQLSIMLSGPLTATSNLTNYYKGTFENNISICKKKFNSEILYLNYTLCAINAVNAAQDYTITNQNSFEAKMEAARCSANTNIKEALGCTYKIKNLAITQMAEVDTLIKKCLLGQDDCNNCPFGYKCPFIYYMTEKYVNSNVDRISNPFYQNYEIKDCLIMKFK